MRKGIVTAVAASSVGVGLLVVGCTLPHVSSGADAGNQPPDSSCVITLKGAATGAYACTATSLYTTNDGGQSAIALADQTQSLQVLLQHPGIITSESWDGGDASAWQATLLVTAVSGGDWACISNREPTTPDIGSYSASVTVKSAPPPTGNGFYTLSGSVDGTLINTSGLPDAAPIMLTATF